MDDLYRAGQEKRGKIKYLQRSYFSYWKDKLATLII
jgi:hypothetical protein